MSNENAQKPVEQWELVVADVVRGTFPTRDEAEAEGARLRRGDEKIFARRAGAARDKRPVETLVQHPTPADAPSTKPEPRK